MKTKDVADALRALASDDKKRSKSARLREVLDDVEAALSAGVTQADVNAELAKQGLQMTLASFRTTLARLRKKRTATPTKAIQNTTPPAVPAVKKQSFKPAVPTQETPIETEEQEPTREASSDPRDIERIAGSPVDLDALAKAGRKRK